MMSTMGLLIVNSISPPTASAPQHEVFLRATIV
jgi:hypothetical protein